MGAIDEMTFWKKRANEYEAMLVELITKIAKGMTVDSIVINEDGIIFKESQPEPKPGKWIEDGQRIPHGYLWMHCSACGGQAVDVPASRTPYCPNCGARMENSNG